MKSPVYGSGRNTKHRSMKGPIHPSAGGVNMKGKKSKRMYCGCCDCYDFRQKLLDKIHKREIQTGEADNAE
jgi:hypothetical protein